jgi:GTP-binding protein
MIISSAVFIKSAVKPPDYPPPLLPEMAFAGRSNVGKSSLINVLVNRKRLVKTSSTPGRTQLLNFFEINKKYSFVDLPGYGYAKVPASVQKNWGPMVETYIQTRKTLRAVVVIMDIRRLPRQEEFDLISWLGHIEMPFIPILTKTDKLSKIKQKKQLLNISQTLKLQKEEFTLFSAKTRKGREGVWARILDMV